ncbi:RNA polymerase sigma factor [Flavisolibacter ginsengisoli]|jgi:RNA polymerase sigma factor (sigma-70 family)|uniref:RNA polymerase sigma factor, sigma-70 family n=1 Tax=Flavisolibacter ginsengisoli DSM 18119 TaxID=1121884 RepID=A0A1M5BTB3_9BACT|nr:RNA polymerase sigma factor [Flavisolibacter ginsengisoli]SHF45779.1 RNA polymerase sigma factor, sigma-70 family [Flavisolibacter ginsengisoli DSM 18119]
MDSRTGSYSDAELLSNLLNNESVDNSIRFLYRQHFEFLSTYVLNNSGDIQDAEDIFQEVIVSFINLVKAGKFRGESSIKTFLYSINRNLWLNELKKRGRAQLRELRYEQVKEEQDLSSSLAIESREASVRLMATLNQLGETCKKILVLFYFENLPMKEILGALHYENEQVVRNKKYKCLKALEEMIRSDKTLYEQLKQFVNG